MSSVAPVWNASLAHLWFSHKRIGCSCGEACCAIVWFLLQNKERGHNNVTKEELESCMINQVIFVLYDTCSCLFRGRWDGWISMLAEAAALLQPPQQLWPRVGIWAEGGSAACPRHRTLTVPSALLCLQPPGCPDYAMLSFMGGFHGRTLGKEISSSSTSLPFSSSATAIASLSFLKPALFLRQTVPVAYCSFALEAPRVLKENSWVTVGIDFIWFEN